MKELMIVNFMKTDQFLHYKLTYVNLYTVVPMSAIYIHIEHTLYTPGLMGLCLITENLY